MKPAVRQPKGRGTSSKKKVNQGKDENHSSKQTKSFACPNSPLPPKMGPGPLDLALKSSIVEHGMPSEPLEKLRLQLFPIDNATCMALEKVGHNPYLELTLGPKKKISSVVRHLNAKWGNSSAAVGELILVPYEAQLARLESNARWSLGDTTTTTSDVYVAVQSPAIFRLRYGWLSYDKPETASLLSKHQDMPCTDREGNNFSSSTPVHGPEPTYNCLKRSVNNTYLARSLEEQAKLKKNCNTIVRLDGNSATINYDHMLARKSSTTKAASQRGHLLTLKNTNLTQTPSRCDLFNAPVAARVVCSQAPIPPVEVPSASILDAEETCQPFKFQKNSAPPGQDNPIIQLQQYSRFPKEQEPGPCTELSISREPATLLRPQAQIQNNSESNLGLASINWDSLGPLEFGTTPKLGIGDQTISFSGILATSRDASWILKN